MPHDTGSCEARRQRLEITADSICVALHLLLIGSFGSKCVTCITAKL